MKNKEREMNANEAVPAATPDDGIKELENLIARVRAAQRKFASYSQEQVDAIFKAAALAANAQRIPLAKMAVEETGRGIYEDKITKNMFATEYVYHSIKYEKTVGIIRENEEDDFILYLNGESLLTKTKVISFS